MAVKPVLLLTNELATVSAVSTALESNGQLAQEDVFRTPNDLSLRLARGPVPAVLVDIDEDPERFLTAMELLARKYLDTRFIVLSGQMSQDLLLAAMQAGARQFLVKQAVAADLSGVLQRLCPTTGISAREGAAVTVLSAGGGSGATTFAVNLAAELQLLSKDRTLVLDLDQHYGGAAAYLGLDGQYGISDLIGRDAPDAQLIQSTAMSYSDHLHALIAAPKARLGEPIALDPLRLRESIEACKYAYPWTVIDAPRIPPMAAVELAKASHAVMLLLQLTVKDLRVAQVLLARLTEAGISANAVQILISRYHRRRSMITVDEARKVLQRTDTNGVQCLSNDYAGVSNAANLGKPLSEAAPRSSLRRELQKLASQVFEARTASAQRNGK